MRQAYQNKRARGRSRKGPNPLSKTYESNGPDVKIRGTAAHIAEKYNTLARDAQSAGDTIQAENYMQHAEHYLRIIAAAQPQQPAQDQRGDAEDDAAVAATGDEAAADMAGEGQERPDRHDRRRQQNGRGGRQRRQPYRNGMNGGADEEAVVPGEQPQPFVNSMLSKPANNPVAESSHLDEAGDEAASSEPMETPASPAANGFAAVYELSAGSVAEAANDAETVKPAPRRRGRPPRAAQADVAATEDGESAAPRPARRRGRPPKAKQDDGESAEV